MNYLPLEVDGQRVHAGFWLRLGAGVIDVLALIPLIMVLTFIEGLGFGLAIVSTVLLSLLYFLYVWYSHAVYGATLGKAAVGIRVTYIDGSRIGWKASFMRASVDFLLAIASMVAYLFALQMVDSAHYVSLDWLDRADLLHAQLPSWNTVVDEAAIIWGISELIALLVNKRRRAIHDYIAGTVVIKKAFSENSPQSVVTQIESESSMIL